MTAIMADGNIREYHNFSWLLDKNGKVKFTQGIWGDMDNYYESMKMHQKLNCGSLSLKYLWLTAKLRA